MNLKLKSVSVALVLAAMSLAATVQAADPGAVCASAKQKAAAKMFSACIKCSRTAIKNGTGIDEACLNKAWDKLGIAFEKAEAKGGCVTIGDAGSVADMVADAFTQVYVALPSAPPPPHCPADGSAGACQALLADPNGACADCVVATGQQGVCNTAFDAGCLDAGWNSECDTVANAGDCAAVCCP